MALKYSHEIKRLYIQVVTPVLVDSFSLIPGTQVSGDKHCGLGKGIGRAGQMTKKMNKLKHGTYALFSDFTEDRSQKSVFLCGSEELFKSYKGSQNTNGQGLKKHSESIKRLLWMMIMIHLKLMIFMLF